MLNTISLQGRLVRDPEIRYTKTDIPVATYTLAVDRGYKDRQGNSPTDFIPCVAWDKRANWASTYLRKGMQIIVQGQLQTRKWQDNEGHNRTAYEVIVDTHHFCESRREERPPHPGDVESQAPECGDFTEVPDDGEVPF